MSFLKENFGALRLSSWRTDKKISTWKQIGVFHSVHAERVEAFLLLSYLRRVIPVRKVGHFLPIASHQCFLLFPAPAFDLLFAREGLFAGYKLFREKQFYRQSCGRVAFDGAALMFRDALFEIVGVACVVRAVRTAKNVHPETHFELIV